MIIARKICRVFSLICGTLAFVAFACLGGEVAEGLNVFKVTMTLLLIFIGLVLSCMVFYDIEETFRIAYSCFFVVIYAVFMIVKNIEVSNRPDGRNRSVKFHTFSYIYNKASEEYVRRMEER